MPAEAGIHLGAIQIEIPKMDAGLRRNDEASRRLTYALYS
jgi:hypothetical protein